MVEQPFVYFSSPPYWAISLLFFVYVHGGEFIPERVCATLYSQNNFQGDSFTLNDFDFSADTTKDYRASISGWLNTSSIHVEKECSMYVCSKSYFRGPCHLINANISEPSSSISQIGSANCTCARECSCENVFLREHEYGRGYLKGGCQTCDNEYWSMQRRGRYFTDQSQSIQTIKIRRDCNLTTFSGWYQTVPNRYYSEEIIKNNFSYFEEFDFYCKDYSHTSPPPKPQEISDPPMITIPETYQGLLQLVSTNNSLAQHPGVQAALKSQQSSRSWKNAYILVIGTTEIDDIFGTRGCWSGPWLGISECRISQPLHKLGISNSEVRIISYGRPPVEEDDSTIMASLDEYLSEHEDLKNAMPNAVVLYWSSRDHYGERAEKVLERQLAILNCLRAGVLDERLSNLIFYFDAETNGQSCDSLVADFEKTISSRWTFPKPTLVMARFDHYEYGYGVHVWKSVNGFIKFDSGEYWPLNFMQKLRVICRGSGDALGEELFNELFVEYGIRKVNLTTSALLPKNQTVIAHYQFCAGNPDCDSATQQPKILRSLSNVEQTTTSMFLDKTDETCNCTSVLDKVSELELELKEQKLLSENLTSQIQQLLKQLPEEKKSNEQEKVMGDTSHDNDDQFFEIQDLEELAELKASKDADSD